MEGVGRGAAPNIKPCEQRGKDFRARRAGSRLWGWRKLPSMTYSTAPRASRSAYAHLPLKDTKMPQIVAIVAKDDANATF